MCKSLSYTLNGITAMCGLIISAYYLMPVLSAARCSFLLFFKDIFSDLVKSWSFIFVDTKQMVASDAEINIMLNTESCVD